MTKKWVFLTISVLLLIVVGCEEKAAVIKMKDEPLIVESTQGDFDYNIIFNYVTLESGSGKKLDNDLISIEGTVNLSRIGTYPLLLKASYNGKITELIFEVRVEDTIAPIIHFVDREILLLIGETEKLNPENLHITAYDYYDGLITERISYEGNIDYDKEGSYRVTFLATDTSGNQVEILGDVRITSSIAEYGRYLYDMTTKIYWGEYYLYDEKLESPDNRLILNHDDLVSVSFTTRARQQFENLANVNNNSELKGIGVFFEINSANYYLLEDKHENRLDYKETVLQLKSQSEDKIVFEAISTYLSTDGTYEEKRPFVLVRIDGLWKVDEYHFPH